MTVAAPPTPIVVTHFTHISHLSTILQLGLLSDTAARQAGLVQTEIGNQEIKEMRRGRAAPVPPRGVVADYAPFYYAPRSPLWRDAAPRLGVVAQRSATAATPSRGAGGRFKGWPAFTGRARGTGA